ncbi:MAG TPA: phosphatase PAP2 family protein [Gemmatimonadaceae bacterium]|nr:phosphatase PAP2 family protein [Gemmatimonadaceae bacterium]
MSKSRSSLKRPEYPLAGIALSAAGTFALLTARVAHNQHFFKDYRRQRKIPTLTGHGKTVAHLIGYAGKDVGVLPLGGAVASGLWKTGNRTGATAVMGAVTASIVLAHLFDRVLPHRSPPPGRREPLNPSFPSGHSLRTSALILTSSYILARESKLDSRVIGGSALGLAALTGIDRILLDRHWTTDVIAGWLGGIALAATASAGYEMKRKSTHKPRKRAPRRKPRKSSS